MQLVEISRVLSADELAKMRGLLARSEFADGGVTGAKLGRQVKHNQQVRGAAEVLAPMKEIVQAALLRREEFTGAVFPRKLYFSFNRYADGMHYGAHNDAAIVGGSMAAAIRSDMSFTLFLTSPDGYDGGELVIEGAAGPTAIKLAAGDAIVYDSSTVHRVEPVTRGARVAAFGWIQSFVRDPQQRTILAQLRRTRLAMLQQHPDADYHADFGNAYNNLLRMWTEG